MSDWKLCFVISESPRSSHTLTQSFTQCFHDQHKYRIRTFERMYEVPKICSLENGMEYRSTHLLAKKERMSVLRALREPWLKWLSQTGCARRVPMDQAKAIALKNEPLTRNRCTWLWVFVQFVRSPRASSLPVSLQWDTVRLTRRRYTTSPVDWAKKGEFRQKPPLQ